MKKDNSTFLFKSELRRKLRREFGETPVILEAYGGYGALYNSCYADVKEGVVIDKDSDKAERLSLQRPTWAVYCGDTTSAIAAGVGNWLEINWLDLDPYGSPWPDMTEFFGSDRLMSNRLAIVVNDGLRQKVKMNGGWDVHELADMVMKYGASAIYDNYLEICKELLQTKAAQRGYSLSRWAGYYCGHLQQMTHYAAILERVA